MNLLHSLLATPVRPSAPAAVRPVHHLNETEDAFALTVQLPGVARDGLDLPVHAELPRGVGRRPVVPPAGLPRGAQDARHGGAGFGSPSRPTSGRGWTTAGRATPPAARWAGGGRRGTGAPEGEVRGLPLMKEGV